MKKVLLFLLLIGLSNGVMAQAEVSGEKHSVATNSFWANWFTQVGAGVGVAQKNPFSFEDAMDYGRTYGIALSVGKWFTPGYGMRITVDWEAFGGRDNVLLPNGLTYEISSGSKNYATVMYENLFNLSN